MIGISLLTLVPGVVGGSETYARELCRALARVGELEYRVFLPTIAEDAADGLPSARRPALPGRLGHARTRAGDGGRARCGAGGCAASWSSTSLDAIHFPLSVMLPLVSSPPAATTILDLQHEFLPENFPRWELAYRRYLYGASARRSRIVIAISEHARETLIERLSLEPERVRTIHLGVDLERFSPADVAREPFVLYPANRWPHKNHETLFRAMALLPEHLRLVLTGYDGPVPEGVESLGRVSHDELVDLYRRASALVFPSLLRGLRPARARGARVRLPGRVLRPAAAPRGRRRRRGLLRSQRPRVDRGGGARGDRARRRLRPERAAPVTWDETARKHDAVYRELAT